MHLSQTHLRTKSLGSTQNIISTRKTQSAYELNMLISQILSFGVTDFPSNLQNLPEENCIKGGTLSVLKKDAVYACSPVSGGLVFDFEDGFTRFFFAVSLSLA